MGLPKHGSWREALRRGVSAEKVRPNRTGGRAEQNTRARAGITDVPRSSLHKHCNAFAALHACASPSRPRQADEGHVFHYIYLIVCAWASSWHELLREAPALPATGTMPKQAGKQPAAAAAAAAADVATSARKARVLCLHGYSQNGQFFRIKTGSLRKACKSVAEFVYIDAPFDATADFLGDIDAIAGDRGQPLSWWQWEDKSSRPALSKTYLGMDETLSKIQKCIDEEGPFDGVLGFSQVPLAASIKLSLPKLSPTNHSANRAFSPRFPQGAALAAMLCRRQAAHCTGIDQPLAHHKAPTPPFGFAILISGFVPSDPSYGSLFAPGTLEDDAHVEDKAAQVQSPVPPSTLLSLHVYGLNDERVPPTTCRRLAASFERAEHHPWDGGHAVPSDAPFRNRLKTFIATAMETGAPPSPEAPQQSTAVETTPAYPSLDAWCAEAERCADRYAASNAIRRFHWAERTVSGL